MSDCFLSNDRSNIFRIGIHSFHAFYPGNFDFSNNGFFELFYQSLRSSKTQSTTAVSPAYGLLPLKLHCHVFSWMKTRKYMQSELISIFQLKPLAKNIGIHFRNMNKRATLDLPILVLHFKYNCLK